MTEYHIRLAEWPQDAESLRAIRYTVFVIEQNVPASLEWDEADQAATHLLALDQKQLPIGTARLLNTGQIGRLAVIKPYRGRGIGKALLQKTVSIAENTGFSSVFLHAQSPVISFYESFGFKVEGQAFYEANIEHVLMRKVLRQ